MEIGKRLEGLEPRKELLRAILIYSTIIVAVLSLLGGRWLANIVMKPMSNMIKTMEEIDMSGVPRTISIQNKTKDELHTMARTFKRMQKMTETFLDLAMIDKESKLELKQVDMVSL